MKRQRIKYRRENGAMWKYTNARHLGRSWYLVGEYPKLAIQKLVEDKEKSGGFVWVTKQKGERK